MKKILAFFVALITCATMWAEPITVRLKASSLPSDWGDVAIYYWSGETIGWPGEKLTLKDGWYSKTFAETTTSINIIWNNNNKGKQTVDIKNVTSSTCYEISGGSDKSYTVEVVECPETAPEVSLTIIGTAFVDSTLTFSAVTTGFSGTPEIAYSIKLDDGDYAPLSGNTYTIVEAGEYTVKAEATYNTEVASAEKSFTAIETPEPITVRLKASSLPSDWGDVAIYYWGNETTDWPGEKLTEVDGWYSKTFKSTTTSINIIWNNNNKQKQTVNIENVSASTCYELGEVSSDKYTTKTVDCKDTVGPGPVVIYDTIMYVAGSFTNWEAGKQELPYTIELPKDSVISFKQIRFVYDEQGDTIDYSWLGQVTKDYYMTRQNVGTGWLLDGENDVLLMTDIEGEYTFGLNDSKFIVTFPYKCENEYGLLVNDEYKAASVNTEHVGGIEYMIKNLTLAKDDSLQLFNNCAKEAWVIEKFMQGSHQFDIVNGKYVVSDTATYDFYFQLGSPDSIYISKKAAPEPEATFYIAGDGSAETGWCCGLSWKEKGCPMVDSTYSATVPAGTYEFKITNGTWETCWGYDKVDSVASTPGYEGEGDGNVKFTVASEANITVSFDGTAIVLKSDVPFGKATITSWTVAGVEALMGSKWDPADTENDMTLGAEGYSLFKTNLMLEAGSYEYKFVANHKWGVKEVPSSGNMELVITDAGSYNVVFTLNAEGTEGSAEATPATALTEQGVKASNVKKMMIDGKLYIVRDGKMYSVLGQE